MTIKCECGDKCVWEAVGKINRSISPAGNPGILIDASRSCGMWITKTATIQRVVKLLQAELDSRKAKARKP